MTSSTEQKNGEVWFLYKHGDLQGLVLVTLSLRSMLSRGMLGKKERRSKVDLNLNLGRFRKCCRMNIREKRACTHAVVTPENINFEKIKFN
jgi:hypothetical protein